MPRPKLGRTIRAIVVWVVPSVVVAELGLFAVRALVPGSVLSPSNDVVGNYLQTLGSIYAVLLAFVVFVVWTQFNEAREHVEREANELVDLCRIARGLSEPTRTDVPRLIHRYAQAVLDREWPALSCGDVAGIEAARGILDQLWDSLHTCTIAGDLQTALYAESLQRFNGVSDGRTNRLTASRQRIPLPIIILLYMGAVAIVGSVYMFQVDRGLIHALITGALAGGLSHLLYVIHDLDDCFDGVWQVPRAAFERVAAHVGPLCGASAVAEPASPPGTSSQSP